MPIILSGPERRSSFAWLNRRSGTQRGMMTTAVVKHFAVLEQIRDRCLALTVALPMDRWLSVPPGPQAMNSSLHVRYARIVRLLCRARERRRKIGSAWGKGRLEASDACRGVYVGLFKTKV
jgi:hypothetical protein